MMSDLEKYKSEVCEECCLWSGNRQTLASFQPVAKLLGLQYMEADANYNIIVPRQPEEKLEPVVREALALVAMFNDETSLSGKFTAASILEGLLRNDRWRNCLSTQERARGLVMLAVPMTRYNSVVTTDIQRVLNVWLKPQGPYEVFSPRSLACALFGEPWCALVYDGLRDRMELGPIIESTQPQFLEGLLAIEPQAVVGLPSLE